MHLVCSRKGKWKDKHIYTTGCVAALSICRLLAVAEIPALKKGFSAEPQHRVFLIYCHLLSQYVTPTETVMEEGTISSEVIPLDTPNCKLLSDVQYPPTLNEFLVLQDAIAAVMILTWIRRGRHWFELLKFRGFPQLLETNVWKVGLLANPPRPPLNKSVSSQRSRSVAVLIDSHVTAAFETSLYNLMCHLTALNIPTAFYLQ